MLDTDVASLLPLLRRGLDWWLGELAELARPLLRERGRAGVEITALRQEDGRYALVRDGVEVGVASAVRPTPAALTLPRALTLLREVPTPGLSRRDWLRLIENDLDRLTPFAADQVYSAVRFGVPTDSGRPRAQLVLTPRSRADAFLQDAMAAGVAPLALLAETPDGEALDLLPAVRAAGRFGERRDGRTWWGIVAVLLVLNIGAAVWRDVRDTDRLQAEADRQRPVAERVAGLRRRVLAERTRRQADVSAQGGTTPLQVLAEATRALPDGAWVQHFLYEDGQLRLTGQHRPGIDAAAALQADPLFANVHAAGVDLDASAAGSVGVAQGFDLVAAVRTPSPGGRR